MCMNPTKVVRIIMQAQIAYKTQNEPRFDQAIEELAEELKKVSVDIDYDALVHSFMSPEEMKVVGPIRVQLVNVSKFWQGDRGICFKCHKSAPIEKMKVSAFAEPDIPGKGLIREINLYCPSCYSKLEALGKLFTQSTNMRR